MKKNLMSVLILALVVANLILTAILMVSVVPQTKNANELITKVCSEIDLELEGGKESASIDIPMEQIESVALAEGASLTINLKDDGNGNSHYAVISVSLALDTKNDGYKTYGAAGISSKEDIIKDEIIKTVSSHTIDELKEDRAGVQDEILARLRKLFDSDFIVSVVFPTYNYE